MHTEPSNPDLVVVCTQECTIQFSNVSRSLFGLQPNSSWRPLGWQAEHRFCKLRHLTDSRGKVPTGLYTIPSAPRIAHNPAGTPVHTVCRTSASLCSNSYLTSQKASCQLILNLQKIEASVVVRIESFNGGSKLL